VNGNQLLLFNVSREKKMADLFKDLWSALQSVDEFVLFKKHFVTALDNDKNRIEKLLDDSAPMRQVAEVVFRCRRVRFPVAHAAEEDGSKHKFDLSKHAVVSE